MKDATLAGRYDAPAALAALDGFPGASRYRRFVEAVAAETARTMDECDPWTPGELDRPVQPEPLTTHYACNVLALLGMAARAVRGSHLARGVAAAQLATALTDENSFPYTLCAESILPHLDLLPDDAVATWFRAAVRVAVLNSDARHDDVPGTDDPAAATRYAFDSLRLALS